MTKPSSRRRKERAQVSQRLRGVFFESPELSSQELRIHNISELGIGIETSQMGKPPALGQVVTGQMKVGYTQASLQIKMAHFTPTTAGFEFVDLPDIVRDAIRLYFEPEIAGASLRLKGQSIDLLSYEDQNENRLEILKSSQGEMKKFIFFVLGNQVIWSQPEGLQLSQNDLMQPLPEYFRRQLVSFIQNAREVDRFYAKQIENILRFLPIHS